jgi:hypothetical protein
MLIWVFRLEEIHSPDEMTPNYLHQMNLHALAFLDHVIQHSPYEISKH